MTRLPAPTTRAQSGAASTTARAASYTTKQMGDACEMLVAGELTLAGVPALKVPDGWPHYDVIAQPRGERAPQRVSVKSRTSKRGEWFTYKSGDHFDWLALVLLPEAAEPRRVFVIPHAFAEEHARRDRPTAKTAHLRYIKFSDLLGGGAFASFENNFTLSTDPRPALRAVTAEPP